MFEKENPITTQISFLDDYHLRSLFSVAKDHVLAYNGLQPVSLARGEVKFDRARMAIAPCLIAEWRTNGVSRDQLNQIDSVLCDLEGSSYSWGRNREGRRFIISDYKTVRNNVAPTMRGYLLGSRKTYNQGIFVGRKFDSEADAVSIPKKKRSNWLTEGDCRVELRLPNNVSNLSAMEYIVRISTILSSESRSFEIGDLICDMYRSINNVQSGHTTSEELAGLEEIMDFMKWTMFASSISEGALRYGLENQSVMLAGVPGLGKTTIAKALACEENGSLFIPIEAITLVDSLSEKRNEKESLYHSAKRLQDRTGVDVVLFCDDIESAMLRPDGGMLSPQYLAGTSSLLNKLQGVASSKMLLSGSTNNPFVIDERFLEFGRVGYVVHMPLPNEIARTRTFEIHMKNKPVSDSLDFKKLGKVTEGFTNRIISEVCNRASEFALRRAAESVRRSNESSFDALKRVTSDIAINHPIIEEDFEKALSVVRKHIRLDQIKDLDMRIMKFCTDYNDKIGFTR